MEMIQKLENIMGLPPDMWFVTFRNVSPYLAVGALVVA
jgi:hypothetical protein